MVDYKRGGEEGRRWGMEEHQIEQGGEEGEGGGRGGRRGRWEEGEVGAQVGKMWGGGGTEPLLLPDVLLSLGQRGLLQGGRKLPHSLLQLW